MFAYLIWGITTKNMCLLANLLINQNSLIPNISICYTVYYTLLILGHVPDITYL